MPGPDNNTSGNKTEDATPDGLQEKFNKLVSVLQDYAAATRDRQLCNHLDAAGFPLKERPHFGARFKS